VKRKGFQVSEGFSPALDTTTPHTQRCQTYFTQTHSGWSVTQATLLDLLLRLGIRGAILPRPHTPS